MDAVISHVESCGSCGEELHMEVPLPKPMYDFQISVYGETVVREYQNKIEISLSDWEKIKGRLIPVMKQGEVKHATGNS